MTSKESYNSPSGAKHHLDFLASEDGQIFEQAIFEAITKRLGDNKEQNLLDAACGPGWLSSELSKTYTNIQGFDGSKIFIEHAKKTYPYLVFQEADLSSPPLPYQNSQFDTIIFSMAADSVEDQVKTFIELGRVLKNQGKLILVIANPYLAFPVGVWKRGIIGRLLFRKPRLRVRPYHWFSKQSRNFTFNVDLECYFYKLSEHINHATKAGFSLTYIEDMESSEDSKKYNLKYRLHRFPILLLMEFKKV